MKSVQAACANVAKGVVLIMSRRWFVVQFVGAALLAACSAGPAGAQSSFGFSISSGGHGHGHHHHCHPRGWSLGYAVGPWWGPGWYAPPPPAVVYAPAPVVQERVIYVQPPAAPPPASPYSSGHYSSTSHSANSQSAGSASQAAVAPVSSPKPNSISDDDRIVIRNAAGAQLPVSFVVDGQDVELADGSVRTFVGRTQRTVQYDRGGKFGSTQQDLSGGQYEFRITATGWDLVRRPEIVVPSRTAVRANALPATR